MLLLRETGVIFIFEVDESTNWNWKIDITRVYIRVDCVIFVDKKNRRETNNWMLAIELFEKSIF